MKRYGVELGIYPSLFLALLTIRLTKQTSRLAIFQRLADPAYPEPSRWASQGSVHSSHHLGPRRGSQSAEQSTSGKKAANGEVLVNEEVNCATRRLLEAPSARLTECANLTS
jgi:hypothetical protein